MSVRLNARGVNHQTDAAALLANLRQQGFQVEVRAGQLSVSPSCRLSTLQKADIRAVLPALTRQVALESFADAVSDHECFLGELKRIVREFPRPIHAIARATRGIERLTGQMCDVADLL